MSDEKQQGEQTPAAVNIFELMETPVTLTYAGLNVKPITFFLRPCLSQEEIELRQKHFALSDKEREEAQHLLNVELLARLSTRTPEGMPGLETVGFRPFFLSEKPINPMKRKVAADAIALYWQVTQPAEFFRSR